MKSVAVIPQQCRKGNDSIQMQRVQEHIHQEKLIGKSFRKYAAYTEMHIDTEKKIELVKRRRLPSDEELKNRGWKMGIQK